GQLVRAVPPGLPAAAAGIKPGDIVLRVNGIEVTPDHSLSGIVSDLAPGTRIPIDILRQGRPMTITAAVAKRPTQDEMNKSFGAPQAPVNPFTSPEKQGEGLSTEALGLQVL